MDSLKNAKNKTGNDTKMYNLEKIHKYIPDINGTPNDYRNFVKRTKKIFSNYNCDINKYKKSKNGTYEFTSEIAAFIILFQLLDGKSKKSIVYKINHEQYEDISGIELLNFINSAVEIKKILESKEKLTTNYK